MKIAIVNTHMEDHLGGSQIQCDVIANGLHNRGHEIIYLAIDKIKENYKTKYSVIGVERDGNDVAEKILEINPDIVYWRFNKRFFYKTVKRIAHKDIKIIFAVSNIKDLQPYGSPILGSFKIKNIKSYLKRILSNRYNHFGFRYIHGLTTNNKEHLKYSPIEKKIYIPNAITDEIVEFDWDNPFIFWVANIKKRKRPEIFVDAAKHFEHDGIDFLMVGKISDHKFDWIKSPDKTPSNFYYLGKKTVEEVNGILSKSLFLVTTSTPEGFSNNLIQAWLQNKPTVSFEFDPGGMIAGKNLGYVCNGDIKSLLEAITKLVRNENLREQIGYKAGEFADNYFSKDKSIYLIESFMQEVYMN